MRGKLILAVAGSLTALASVVLAVGLGETHGLVGVAGPGAFVVVVMLLLLTRHFAASLAVCMLYIACIDGYLRLKTGIGAATLGRDALLYAVVAGVLVRQAYERRRVDVPPLSVLVGLWAALVLVQVLNPANESWSHALTAVRPHLEFVPLYFLGYWVMRSRQRLLGFLVLLAVAAAANGVVSYVQSTLTPDQLAAWGPGFADRIYGIKCVDKASGNCLLTGRLSFDPDAPNGRVRPMALGSDFGFGGGLGLLALPSLLALSMALPSRRFALRLALLPLLVGSGAAVISSQTRSAVIGAIVAAAAFVALTVKPGRGFRTLRGVAIASVLGYVVVVFVGGAGGPGIFRQYESISPKNVFQFTYGYRKDTFAVIPDYVVDFPLGAGLGNVGPAALSNPVQRGLNGESQPTFLLVELGVPGLLLSLLFTLRILALTGRVRRITDAQLAPLLAAIAAGFAAISVLWIIAPVTAAPPFAPFYWFAAGIMVYWLYGRRDTSLQTSRPAATA